MVFFVLWVFLHAITAVVLSVVALGPLREMLRAAGAVKANFRQREVVNMMGVLIILAWVFLMVIAALALLVADDLGALGVVIPQGFIIGPDIAMPLTILIVGAGLFGLIDDALGSRDATGFKGHIGALLRGRLTTGALKAIGIPAIAVFAVSLFSEGVLEALGNGLLVALFVNALNLLDLRPGRALKVYIPLQVFFVFAAGSALAPAAAALAGIALVLIWADLREEIMLGDTGSNILGAALGFYAAATYGWGVKLGLIVALVIMQVLTEKYSISAVVERIPLLRTLDNLGRRAD